MMLLSAVWTFLKSPLGKYVLIGLAVLAAVVAFGTIERHSQAVKDAPWITNPATHRKWKDEAVEAARDLKTCKTNTTTLTDALDRQSTSVAALKADSEARLAQSQKQTLAARAVAASYRMTADVILKAKAGKDACQSADALISEAVK